jgi:hypothetical protein
MVGANPAPAIPRVDASPVPSSGATRVIRSLTKLTAADIPEPVRTALREWFEREMGSDGVG